MEATQRLFDDADYVTRLFTTMSPDEMRTDPVFLFNPELEEVDNVHQRERLVTCSDGGGQTWQMDFDGVLVEGGSQSWPIDIGDLPANWRVLQLGTSGPGEVVSDNSDTIDDMMPLEPAPGDGPSVPSEPGPSAVSEDPERPNGEGPLMDGGERSSEALVTGEGGGCGCRTVGGGSLPQGAFALLALGLVLVRRRQCD